MVYQVLIVTRKFDVISSNLCGSYLKKLLLFLSPILVPMPVDPLPEPKIHSLSYR